MPLRIVAADDEQQSISVSRFSSRLQTKREKLEFHDYTIQSTVKPLTGLYRVAEEFSSPSTSNEPENRRKPWVNSQLFTIFIFSSFFYSMKHFMCFFIYGGMTRVCVCVSSSLLHFLDFFPFLIIIFITSCVCMKIVCFIHYSFHLMFNDSFFILKYKQ